MLINVMVIKETCKQKLNYILLMSGLYLKYYLVGEDKHFKTFVKIHKRTCPFTTDPRVSSLKNKI